MISSFKPIKERKIRVGILGCGRISENHIKAISQNFESLNLVALCDKEEDQIPLMK